MMVVSVSPVARCFVDGKSTRCRLLRWLFRALVLLHTVDNLADVRKGYRVTAIAVSDVRRSVRSPQIRRNTIDAPSISF